MVQQLGLGHTFFKLAHPSLKLGETIRRSFRC